MPLTCPGNNSLSGLSLTGLFLRVGWVFQNRISGYMEQFFYRLDASHVSNRQFRALNRNSGLVFKHLPAKMI